MPNKGVVIRLILSGILSILRHENPLFYKIQNCESPSQSGLQGGITGKLPIS
ncbi:hypothetical protein FC25_GL000019 [Ligilactobacillus ruminis DSM 20403 = NBRC 102161]|nr:hypothetical protein FC25_GL000019 [Ligilactobacillus ruminis DSM 20403 = NBRC 102161]